MARLPPRGSPDPVTDKYELQLAQRVAFTFWLPGERVVHAGLGQHEATAERYGRGQGEGVLYLTTHRFVFWFGTPVETEFLAIPKEKVVEVSSHRIVVAGMRALDLSIEGAVGSIGDAQGRVRFYVGRPLAEVIERDWREARTFREPAVGVRYPTMRESEERSAGDPATLTGLLMNEPSVRVIAHLEDTEVVMTSWDGSSEERVSISDLSAPSEQYRPGTSMSFQLRSPDWGFLVFDPPVSESWIGLADELREQHRAVKAASGSKRSTDQVVADLSPEVQHVWYVLPPPLEGLDVGVSIDSILNQTGLTSAMAMRALADLEDMGLSETNDKGEFRRVEDPGAL